MKKILLLLMILTGVDAFAQDPDVGGTTIQGTVGDGSGPHANGETVSFTITAGNAGPNMAYPPPSNAPFEINITIAHLDNPVVTIAPGFANYFAPAVITQTNSTIPVYTIVITQNSAIPETEYTRFIITGKVKGSDGDLVQYQANGDPGGYPNVGTDDPSAQAEILGTVLPVKLISFGVAKEGSAVSLAWSTSEETNSERFDVQHSMDGKNWKELGAVKSNGESSIKQNYSFIHQGAAKGINYYRLKMVDLDGSYEFSGIRATQAEGRGFNAYPNPAAELLTVEAANLSRVRLYSLTGVPVYDSRSAVVSRINVGSLSNGVYLIQLNYNDGSSESQKIVISK